MAGIIHRLAIIGASALAPLAFVALVSPGVSNATECGWGTVFDPPSNTCVAAPLPPPPPPHRHRRRRPRGTVISRRASGLAFACPFPFRSYRRCAPASKPSPQLPVMACPAHARAGYTGSGRSPAEMSVRVPWRSLAALTYASRGCRGRSGRSLGRQSLQARSPASPPSSSSRCGRGRGCRAAPLGMQMGAHGGTNRLLTDSMTCSIPPWAKPY